MSNGIFELIIAILLILISILNIFLGKRFYNFLYQRKIIGTMRNTSPDEVYARSILASIAFIGIGVYLIISSFR